TEAVARILRPPYLGMGIDFFANRFLPAQLYKPTRTAETIKELADTFNESEVGVLFNAYNPTTGEGVLFGNNAARERMKTQTSISILSDQKSRDPRIAKPSGKEQAILAITPTAIESPSGSGMTALTAFWRRNGTLEPPPGDAAPAAYRRLA